MIVITHAGLYFSSLIQHVNFVSDWKMARKFASLEEAMLIRDTLHRAHAIFANVEEI